MANTIENIVGFDSGSTQESTVSAGTISIQSTVKRTGGYALRVNPTTTGTGSWSVLGYGATGIDATLGLNPAYVSFYFRADTLPAANDEEIFKFQNSTPTVKWAIRINSSGNLVVYDSSDSVVSTGTTVLSTSTWYRIDAKGGNGNVAYEVKINESTELSGTFAQGATNVSRVVLGKNVNKNGQSVDFYYDDVWVDSQDYAPSGYAVGYLVPASDGATQQWTTGTNSSNYAEIAEIPLDTATYIQVANQTAPTTAQFNVQTFSAAGLTAASSITGAKFWCLARDTAAVTNSIQVSVKSGVVTDSTSTQNTANSFTPLGNIAMVNPDGLAAWTESTITAAYFQFVENTSNVTAVRVYWGAAVVGYIPSAATTDNLRMRMGMGT